MLEINNLLNRDELKWNKPSDCFILTDTSRNIIALSHSPHAHRVEFTQLAADYKAVNLGQGFPDFSPPQFIQEAFCKAINGGPQMHQYTRAFVSTKASQRGTRFQSFFWGIKRTDEIEIVAEQIMNGFFIIFFLRVTPLLLKVWLNSLVGLLYRTSTLSKISWWPLVLIRPSSALSRVWLMKGMRYRNQQSDK